MQTSTTSYSLVNWAEWYLPTQQFGYWHNYALQAYISSAGPTPYTQSAPYRRWCCGHANGITQWYWLNHQANQGGLCYQMGTGNMSGSQGGFTDIIDDNDLGDGDLYVDIFCFRALNPD